MARVIAIFNHKGGVGKTTTAVNLSAYLGMLGYKTLLVDFDPQYNATMGVGVRHVSHETIYHALLGGRKPEEVIKQTYLANLYIIPASADLSGALIELVTLPEREWYLKKFVDRIEHTYDYILIDLGPSLNLLTINGLLAASEVIIPIQCEFYSLEGVNQLVKTLELIKNNIGHDIKIGGALLTMYDKREKLSREVAREIRRRFPYSIYEVEIPKSVALAEAPQYQKPIMLYAPQSSGALAYERLAREIVTQSGAHIPNHNRFVEESLDKEETRNMVSEEEKFPPRSLVTDVFQYETENGVPLPLIIHYHEDDRTYPDY